MTRLSFSKAGFRRVLLPLTAACALIAATADVAHACFFGCLYHFGYITVANGEVYYYNGCTERVINGETYVTCFYTEAMN